jgi:NADH-quinone oxidoreductase subunit C
VVVDAPRLADAARHLRDELGFNYLSDVAATVATQGYQRLPRQKPRRFSVSYHLLGLCAGAPRVRLQVWVDEDEQVPSLVSVWPTADWHEREAFDLMGLRFDGHPNQRRILMDDDWEGHPLRKDYPIGGEPVRFSGEA